MNEELMIRYLQGECSPKESTLFLEWLQQSDENKAIFLEYKAVWGYRAVKHFAADEQLEKATVRLNQEIYRTQSQRRKQVYIRFMRYAAIVVFALAAVLYTTYRSIYTEPELITVSIAETDSSKYIRLSDGSSVWLNSNSSITYPKKFSSDVRAVQFTGEAYFKVAHDPTHPFQVGAENIQVRVLGTSFNIRAYASERKTETTLIEGSVVIQNKQGHNLATLAPGQMAGYDKISRSISMKTVDPEPYVAWRYGLISFTNATLIDITERLSELYTVKFEINPSDISRASYNFNFQKNQSVEQVLEMLSFIAPIQYHIDGNIITITPV